MHKNFDDFLKVIDVEAIYSNSTHSIDSNMELEEMVLKTSISFSVALLRAYHEWITAAEN